MNNGQSLLEDNYVEYEEYIYVELQILMSFQTNRNIA